MMVCLSDPVGYVHQLTNYTVYGTPTKIHANKVKIQTFLLPHRYSTAYTQFSTPFLVHLPPRLTKTYPQSSTPFLVPRATTLSIQGDLLEAYLEQYQI